MATEDAAMETLMAISGLLGPRGRWAGCADAGTVVAVNGGNVSFTLAADYAIAISITDRL